MGRKQKLRTEKRITKAREAAIAAISASALPRDITKQDSEFPPTSDFAVPLEDLVSALSVQDHSLVSSMVSNLRRGAMEEGCVHTLYRLGALPPHLLCPSRKIPEGGGLKMKVTTNMWCFWLEGAIRGSVPCTANLMRTYGEINPQPLGIQMYWSKMTSSYLKWNEDDRAADCKVMTTNDNTKVDADVAFRNYMDRRCIICRKTDTNTSTLLQCKGCSIYCYCSTECQELHWSYHRGECKQLRILTKYHKPFAKKIRAAAIDGEIYIPAVEKLRHKLGLSRPVEDYQEMDRTNTKHAYLDFIAREDGTVWIGSFPNSIGNPPSSDASNPSPLDDTKPSAVASGTAVDADGVTSAPHQKTSEKNTVLGLGYLSYGHRLPKYLGITREKVFYHIPDFATLPTKKGHYIASNTIQACNQEWVLLVYPRGDDEGDGKVTHITTTAVDDNDDGDSDYVSVHLLYIGHNPETDPVCVKIAIYTTADDKKTDKEEQIKTCFTFSTKQISQCLSPNLVHHKNALQHACNSVTGAFTITMEIEEEEEEEDDDDEEHQKISATVSRPSPPYFSPSFIANRCRCGENDPRLCRCGRE